MSRFTRTATAVALALSVVVSGMGQQSSANDVEPTPTAEITRTPRDADRARDRFVPDHNREQQETGIVAGEWDLVGESRYDILYVVINEDDGRAPGIIADISPDYFAVDLGAPLIGEGRAPEGCRLFAYSGPWNVVIYVAMCADGEYRMHGMSTDKDVIDDVMQQFVDQQPYEPPHGYEPVD